MTIPHTGSQLIGSLRAENGKGVVRMEEVYDTSMPDLWSALTQPDRLSRWLAEVSGDLRLGGRFQARFTSGWDGPGRVAGCEPHSHLLAIMNPGLEDETQIEATLTAEGDRTRLVIEERGLPLDAVAAHGAGWQAHVEDLSSHLAGRDAADWVERWTELIPKYRELAAEVAQRD
ncbi:MAG: SRPBCC family protein [Actinomycetota bacterium]|nr:SRPBCC family protein [Actinomycetota bacterium]MDQ2958994.1 SRPBCC family protein [Actinomycetota bacterium]